MSHNSQKDLAGNTRFCQFYGYFTTGFAADSTPPAVLATDPADGDVGVPVNAQVTVQLSEAVDPTSVNAATVQVRRGGAAVAAILTLEDGDRRLRLVPSSPLVASAGHTLTLSGLRDRAGNALAAPLTVSFTTGPGADLVGPTVTGVNPVDGATGVARDIAPTVVFSEAVNPLTVNTMTVQLQSISTGIVEATVTLDAGRRVGTLTPAAPLEPDTTHCLFTNVRDTAANLGFSRSCFTTGP